MGLRWSREYLKNDPTIIGLELSNIAELLLANGADINRKNKDGEMMLHWIVDKFPPDDAYVGVSILVENGANVNVKDKDGRTPLHTAAKEQ